MHSHTTIATNIAATIIGHMPANGPISINKKERIAHIIKCADAKNDVIDSTNTSQTAKIEHGITKGKFMPNIVYRGQTYDKDCPNRCQKER